MSEPYWLVWARRIQALAQSGLHFTKDAYERERYEALRELAAEMMAAHCDTDMRRIDELFARQTGYATPRVDVRGAVFDEQGRILMVREKADAGRWTLPGGWCDVNQSGAESVVREVWEEAGLAVRAVKLAAVYDRAKQGHEPPYPFHIYKMFFICEPLGAASDAKPDGFETTEAAYFAEDAVPVDELSAGRVTAHQIARMFAHRKDPGLAADFD